MTRENKVALVVGFALVLFVGILISDHFSRARARPADLVPAAAEPPPPSHQILDVRREPSPARLPFAETPSLASALAAAPPAGGAQPPPALPASTSTAQPAVPAAVVPPPSPAAIAAPPGDPAGSSPPLRLHEVRPGESLSSICQHYYGDQRLLDKLAAYNGINDPDNIWGGARLRVPPLEVLAPGTPAAAPAVAAAKSRPARYQVQEGDTLCSIAQRMLHSRTRWKQLYEVNREVISDPDNIRPGSVLRIPAG